MKRCNRRRSRRGANKYVLRRNPAWIYRSQAVISSKYLLPIYCSQLIQEIKLHRACRSVGIRAQSTGATQGEPKDDAEDADLPPGRRRRSKFLSASSGGGQLFLFSQQIVESVENWCLRRVCGAKFCTVVGGVLKPQVGRLWSDLTS